MTDSSVVLWLLSRVWHACLGVMIALVFDESFVSAAL